MLFNSYNIKWIFTLCVLAAVMLTPHAVMAQYTLNWSASATAGAGNGDFAPYYMSALQNGRFSSSKNFQTEASVWREMKSGTRFSYGFGVDVMAGCASKVEYERYDRESDSWYWHPMRPASTRIQQLYAEVKYRSLYVNAGMKECESPLLNQQLTSGDLVQSGNARPIPQILARFIDFQDIPFTDGWLQIQAELTCGKKTDDAWWRDHYNYYNWYLAQDEWRSYKHIFFRTKPSKPFSVTFGGQLSSVFGGFRERYVDGKLVRTFHNTSGLKAFFKTLIPTSDGGEGFYTGNHLGSMDIMGRYRFKSGHVVKGYLMWPFEDGSGIGKLNGWDGLWGLEYVSPDKDSPISGVVVEYIDFTNQSGPIHFDPNHTSPTTVTGHTSGGDDYYNHKSYNSYAYYGLSLGTPAIMAPIYNLDGYNRFIGNALRGIHIGMAGHLCPGLDYRVKGGYRKAWGNGDFVLNEPLHLASLMAEVNWKVGKVPGLTVNCRMEVDRGNMPANSFGAMVSVRYDGVLGLKL